MLVSAAASSGLAWSFVIWIDAICINQNDEREKANQISLMQDIYSTTNPTYIWLGEGNPGTDEAMYYLRSASFQKYLVPETEIHYTVPANNHLRWKLALSEFFGCYIALLCCKCILASKLFLAILELMRVIHRQKR